MSTAYWLDVALHFLWLPGGVVGAYLLVYFTRPRP